MEETKYIKGEWVAVGDTYPVIESKHKDTKTIKTHTTIATVNSTFREKEEYQANAKLIAAAPDLLEALIELEKQIIRLKLSEPQALRIKASRVKAKKAIEKATL